MQVALPSPISCCRPCCRDTVVVITSGTGSTGVNPTQSGEEDPVTAGITPDNTAYWAVYKQVDGDGKVVGSWDWNPDTQAWS
jgi:hypothetical protein